MILLFFLHSTEIRSLGDELPNKQVVKISSVDPW